MTGAIPMSMPAILQQPKNKHLLGALGKSLRRDENERNSGGRKAGKEGAVPGGKRRKRRWENGELSLSLIASFKSGGTSSLIPPFRILWVFSTAQLAGNPHLHRPTRSDFAPGPSLKDLSTVFAPPPTNFSRSTYTTPPSSTSSSSDAFSKESGQFSMSLRGLRRNLRTGVVGNKVRRGEGGRIEEVLEIMERELKGWLEFQGKVEPGYFHTSSVMNGKLLDPTPLEDFQFPSNTLSLPDEPVRSNPVLPPTPPPTLVELTRLPHTLVWLAPSPQHRYLLHSLSRYYKLQSFSRPLSPLDSETRVTHILRPQLNKPVLVNTLGRGFETPSATDWSSASGVSTEVETTEISASEESEAEFTEGTFTTDDEEGFTTDEGESVRGRVLDELSSGGESDYGADRETGFTTDEGEDDYTDSLASSFANLAASSPQSQPGSAVPATPTSISRTETATPLPPFIPYTPIPPTPPTPSTLANALSTARPVTRARGRRSLPLNGRDSLESSPSRSPTRGTEALEPEVAVNKGEWKMPERGFVDWVFEE